MSCNDKNSLVREGCSIYNRVLAAIRTDYARVDEREIADLILFAKRYASYLNYYDQNNIPAGDWQALMKMDACVSLAALSNLHTRSVFEYRQLLYKRIKDASQATTGADAKTMEAFKFLFDLIFSLVGFIDEQYTLVPDDLSKKDILKGSINNKMADALENILKLYGKFITDLLIDPLVNTTDQLNAPVEIKPSQDFRKEDLSSAWETGSAAYNILDLVSVPAKTATFTEKDQVVWIINHNLFNAQVDNLLKGIAFISTAAKDIFNLVIRDYPKHSPHYTLFLSFLKLFRIAQDDLNRYTQRHLDFYYKEVLQLGNKAARPDQAHLLFELPKPLNQYLLKKGTEFNAGKDSIGKDLKYTLTEDVILSKANIEKIHSWQRTGPAKQYLKAAVIANSDNGIVPAITSADKSWFTFGDPAKTSFAEAGFGIASNILFLTEGVRDITCTIRFKNDVPGLNSGNLASKPVFLKANITGKKGWYKIPGPEAIFTSANTLECSFFLDADAPAIVPYTEALHKSNLGFSLPLLQVFIDQEKDGMPYTTLSHLAVESINVTVEVTGIKDLALSHDNGTIDPSKPFKPFGDFPVDGASFYIGSNEVFQKKLTSVSLGFDWVNDTPSFMPKASFLSKNNWGTRFDFSGSEVSVDDTFKKTAPNFEKNNQLRPDSIEGFLRIRLKGKVFSYKQYLDDISAVLNTTQLKHDAQDKSIRTLSMDPMPAPNELITRGLTLAYTASEKFTFGSGNNPEYFSFIHFTPFGYRKVHPKFTSDNPSLEEIEHYSLVPDIIHDGELFLGIADAQPGAVINILFQVAEGSSNPLKDMEPISWYFLNNDQYWEKFRTSDIIDRSNNFTESGIVTVTLPSAISPDHRSFTNGLYWIKASVENNTDAVCRMILVQAQAAKVILKQDVLNQVEFRETLKANSISKLTNADASIKKITQPADSFGGRKRELDDQFYVRVSERLRHKQRAISIWDYEHLVLEEFQDIFKVRCLNHSGFYMDGSTEVFCENYPGHVTLITIPNLRSGTYINPLRPYTSSRVLNNIQQFISRLKSPFVKLHVKNPRFEEVQLDFKVKFHEHMDESFYLKLLNDEIERFLCPWAYDESKEISFGGKVIRSVLLNFVEERPYVNFVTCFKMNHIISRDGNVHTSEIQDVEEAIPSTSRSMLVSYYNEITNTKHKIVSATDCEC